MRTTTDCARSSESVGPDPRRDDTEQIRALVCAYAERLDAGDLDGVAALFTHGRFRSVQRSAPLVGRDAVRSVYEPVRLYDDGTPRTKHVLGDIEVQHGPERDEATARCTFVVMQAAPGGPLQAVLSGRYHDRFARLDDAWSFAERVVHPDLVGNLSGHMHDARR
jgi:3-phenylpropionate/cinnamic acid dioxygenase small subunit